MLRLAVFAIAAVALVLFIAPFFLKTWPRRLASIAGGVVVAIGAVLFSYHAYHVVADRQRVDDLHRIAGVIEAFHDRTGRYPLATLAIPVTVGVNLTDADLPARYRRPPPGAPGQVVPYSVFLNELRSVLGEDLVLPQDPQTVEVYAPNFYQYQYYEGGHYYLSGNLYFERPGTERLGPHYFKYELSSRSRPRE